MLWDVPIFFFARFGQSSEDLAVLEQLLVLPPEKFLGLGTNQLLMGLFRGGRGAPVSGGAPLVGWW